jgi:ribonuclease-3
VPAKEPKSPPTLKRKRKFADLEKALGYRFKDQTLVTRALTHSSTRGAGSRDDNERLEFLGDRVLGLAIASALIAAFPDDAEGELARRFNQQVKRETCAAVGRTIELGRHLILSDSEAGSGGRDKDTILADAVEALLGAIHLDGGFTRAEAIVLKLWQVGIAGQPHAVADPKSALQEWAQGRGMPLPRYVEVGRSGPDHAPRFVSEVRINGCKPAQGSGPSKRAAEQAAATAMLKREGVVATETVDAE